MPTRTVGILISLVIFLSASIFALHRSFVYPFAPLKLAVLPQYAITDMALATAGMRRLGADIAWVQLLQYYGGPPGPDADRTAEYDVSRQKVIDLMLGRVVPGGEECKYRGCAEHGHHHGGHGDNEAGFYVDFLKYCWRIVYFDPFASYAYLTGSAGLAWNMGRIDEAMQLLQYGINVTNQYGVSAIDDPRQPFWQYHLYMSAIIYKQKGDFSKMLDMLKKAARQANCPNMVKVILANVLESGKDYRGALKLWLEVYSTGDPMYLSKSQEKIEMLRDILGL